MSGDDDASEVFRSFKMPLGIINSLFIPLAEPSRPRRSTVTRSPKRSGTAYLVGLHELGHTCTRGFGIRVPSRWAGEMLATYFAYAYVREHDPKQAEVWDGILRADRDAVRPKHTTLADFDRLYFGVGAQNYIWYQGRFQQMVRQVYDAQGLNFLRAVRDAFPAGEAGPPTPEEAMEWFEKIYPGVKQLLPARQLPEPVAD